VKKMLTNVLLILVRLKALTGVLIWSMIFTANVNLVTRSARVPLISTNV
jgi:hypothetical protein